MIFVVCYLIDRHWSRIGSIWFSSLQFIVILLSIYFWSAARAGHPSGQIGQNRAASPLNNGLSLPTTFQQFNILRWINLSIFFFINMILCFTLLLMLLKHPTSLTDVASFDFEHFACASRWRDEGRDKSLSKRCPPSL